MLQDGVATPREMKRSLPARQDSRHEGRTQGWTWPGGAIVLRHGGVAGSLPPCDSGDSGTKAGLNTSNGREGKRWGPGLWVLTVCSGKSLWSWIEGASRCCHHAWGMDEHAAAVHQGEGLLF